MAVIAMVFASTLKSASGARDLGDDKSTVLRRSTARWWTSHFDDYDMFMQAGSAGELGAWREMGQIGFWRKLLEHPSYRPLPYRFSLPTANHVFLPRHRIMVQLQSSWFPLYDRNPQTFVPNIFWAKPVDYRKAVQRIYHQRAQASFIELPLVLAP